MKIKTEEKTIEHPLETVFGIESGTTVVEYNEFLPEPLVDMPNYDVKDDEIEGKLEQIYTTAIGQANTMADSIEVVEGRYKARMGEVTANMLNVALGAVREQRMMKEHKDKLSPFAKKQDGHTTTNNNLVIADRNEILRMIAGNQR